MLPHVKKKLIKEKKKRPSRSLWIRFGKPIEKQVKMTNPSSWGDSPHMHKTWN